MTSSIMHSCDESDDSLRITSVEVEVNVGTLSSLAACSTQDKKLDSCIKYHFAWNQTQYPVS